MQSRIKNPAMQLPGAMHAVLALNSAVKASGLPPTILGLVHLRTSQTNGCSACVDSRFFHAKNWPLLKPRSRQNAAALWPLWCCSPTTARHFVHASARCCLMTQD